MINNIWRLLMLKSQIKFKQVIIIINFELIYISIMMCLMLEIISLHIRPKRCPLKTNHKLQVNSARSFKVLQMIESNSHVIKLPLNFDIIFTFDMKYPVKYKTQ